MSKNSRFEKAFLSVWEIRRRVVRVTDTQQNNASHLYIEEQCPQCGQWLARTTAIHGPGSDGSFVCSAKVFEARDQWMLAATAVNDPNDPTEPNGHDPERGAA